MTVERWSVDQLGALADEWMAEREAFLSALHTYTATQLSQSAPAQPHPIAPAVYQAELAAMMDAVCQHRAPQDVSNGRRSRDKGG